MAWLTGPVAPYRLAVLATAVLLAASACFGGAARYPAGGPSAPAPTAPPPAEEEAEAPLPALPRAFPGAEGFGAQTPGGRGGRVIAVTSLADFGPGTLRAALEARGPRIVVFRTGGTITLEDQIRITDPFVTVAGQTAPGDGITLRASPSQHRGLVVVATHDVVIRYVRFRQGAHRDIDAAIPLSATGARDVVIDHCSLSWGTDEVLTLYEEVRDITISWNVIAEGLSESTHYEGEHSRGLFISGEGSARISAHHNLMAHNMRRNPEVNTEGTADIRNNVVYNWGTHGAQFSGKYGRHKVNVVENYFKPGPSTTDRDRREVDTYQHGRTVQLYVHGNIGPHRETPEAPDVLSVDPDGRDWMVPTPAAVPQVTTTSAEQAYDDVLAGAGARVPTLDAVDRRILADVRGGTGRIIDDPEDVGGWPDLDAGTAPRDSDSDGMPDAWEVLRGQDDQVDDSAGDRDGDGYTNIEEYVNGLLGR